MNMAKTQGYQPLTFRIEGTTPLLMHNGRLSDQLDPMSIALSKAVKAAKKTKTDEAIVEVARIEFLGGLYVGEDGAPCIPGEVLEAGIRSGAKVTKEGKAVQMGLYCDGNFPIIYDGPKTPEELWEHRTPGERHLIAGRPFVDRRRVRVGQAAVMRTRPIFHAWQLAFTVYYEPSILNRQSVIDFVTALGRTVGLCEIRPRFGRFEILQTS
jgi:hypothetical protein